MRKNFVLVIVIAIISCFVCGCVERSTGNHQAVDDISKYVKESTDGEFYFQSRVVYDIGETRYFKETRYFFEIRDFDAVAIGNFVDAFNTAVSSDDEHISCGVQFYGPGRQIGMFYLQNFNDAGEMFDGMRYLRIWDPSEVDEQAANPALYSEIEGIKELHVDRSIQDKADDMGIDWYNYWPDLETVVIED